MNPRAFLYLLLTEGVWIGLLTPMFLWVEYGSVTVVFAEPALVAIAVVVGLAAALLSLASYSTLLDHGGGGTPLAFNPPKRLVEAGIYGAVRNPQAIGMLVLGAAVALALDASQVWFLPGLIAIYLFVAALPGERRQLEELHGDAYQAYRERVPAWLPRRRVR